MTLPSPAAERVAAIQLRYNVDGNPFRYDVNFLVAQIEALDAALTAANQDATAWADFADWAVSMDTRQHSRYRERLAAHRARLSDGADDE